MQLYPTPNRVATVAFFAKMQALRAVPAAVSIVSKPATVSPAHTFGREFLASYTPEHRAAVAASIVNVVDAETTGRTPNDRPISVGGGANIGPVHTLRSYRAMYGDAVTVDVRLRMRVWSVQLDNGARLAWDLDRLSDDDRRAVVWDTLHAKTVIGHNLAFDFTWAVALCGRDLQPALVLDVMLLARCLKPASVYAVHRRAVHENEASAAARRVIDKRGNASVSLAALTIGAGMDEPDKSWQKPRNWTVSQLCTGHYDYVMGDIDAPLDLLKYWTSATTAAGVIERLREIDAKTGGAYFDIYERVPLALAKISHTGMPVHVQTLEAVRDYRRSLMPALIETVVNTLPTVSEVLALVNLDSKAGVAFIKHVQEEYGTLEAAKDERAMAVFLKKLEAQSSATLAPMKLVLAAYAEMNDCKLDENDDGMPIINAQSGEDARRG